MRLFLDMSVHFMSYDVSFVNDVQWLEKLVLNGASIMFRKIGSILPFTSLVDTGLDRSNLIFRKLSDTT